MCPFAVAIADAATAAVVGMFSVSRQTGSNRTVINIL